MNDRAPVRTSVDYEGQPYVDEPIITYPNSQFTSPIAESVSAAFNGGVPDIPLPIQTGWQMVRLKWMKPDGKGGLIPRDETPEWKGP